MGNLFLRILAVCLLVAMAAAPVLAVWLGVSGREGAVLGVLLACDAVCVAVGITELVLRRRGL